MNNKNGGHWALNYIGKQHISGASGPDAYDCLAFAVEIQRTHYQTEMSVSELIGIHWKPTTLVEKSDVFEAERSKWVRVNRPSEGDLVLMSHNNLPVHIGVWIKANGTEGVLHCAEKVGVVFQIMGSLVRMGWGSFSYYSHKCKQQP